MTIRTSGLAQTMLSSVTASISEAAQTGPTAEYSGKAPQMRSRALISQPAAPAEKLPSLLRLTANRFCTTATVHPTDTTILNNTEKRIQLQTANHKV